MVFYHRYAFNWLLPDLQKASVPNENTPMKRSIRSSKTSNIIDTDIPKYNDRDPPTADTKDPIN